MSLSLSHPGNSLCLLQIWSVTYFTAVFLSVLFYVFETSMSFREVFPYFEEYCLTHYNVSSEYILPYMNIMDKYGISQPVAWLNISQDVIFFFFLGEYVLRLITCPQKLYFMKQARNNFDLLLVVQNAIAFILKHCVSWEKTFTEVEMNGIVFFYSIYVLRVLRIFYITKNMDTMKVNFICYVVDHCS